MMLKEVMRITLKGQQGNNWGKVSFVTCSVQFFTLCNFCEDVDDYIQRIIIIMKGQQRQFAHGG